MYHILFAFFLKVSVQLSIIFKNMPRMAHACLCVLVILGSALGVVVTGPRAQALHAHRAPTPPPSGYVSLSDLPANLPEADVRRITQVNLPDSNSSNAGGASFSAFINVDRAADANLFFWFFESRRGGKAAPVILWLEGGPGCSSMMETTTIGPLSIGSDSRANQSGNVYSWTEDYSVLFVDNPVGAGFSFAADPNVLVTNELQMATHLYDALQQFFARFASVASNDFYIFGISYGGKYVPSIASYIMDRNAELLASPLPSSASPNAPLVLNLRGIGLGSPFIDPVRQVGHYAEFAFATGLADLAQRGALEQLQLNTVAAIARADWNASWNGWNDILGAIANSSGGANPYFVRTFDPNLYDFPHTVAFFQQPAVRAALHVGTREFCPDCADFIPGCDPTVYARLQNDMLQSVAPLLPRLFDKLKVFVFSGQDDMIVAVPVASYWVDAVQWTGRAQWLGAVRAPFALSSDATKTPTAFVKYAACIYQCASYHIGFIYVSNARCNRVLPRQVKRSPHAGHFAQRWSHCRIPLTGHVARISRQVHSVALSLPGAY